MSEIEIELRKLVYYPSNSSIFIDQNCDNYSRLIDIIGKLFHGLNSDEQRDATLEVLHIAVKLISFAVFEDKSISNSAPDGQRIMSVYGSENSLLNAESNTSIFYRELSREIYSFVESQSWNYCSNEFLKISIAEEILMYASFLLCLKCGSILSDEYDCMLVESREEDGSIMHYAFPINKDFLDTISLNSIFEYNNRIREFQTLLNYDILSNISIITPNTEYVILNEIKWDVISEDSNILCKFINFASASSITSEFSTAVSRIIKLKKNNQQLPINKDQLLEDCAKQNQDIYERVKVLSDWAINLSNTSTTNLFLERLTSLSSENKNLLNIFLSKIKEDVETNDKYREYEQEMQRAIEVAQKEIETRKRLEIENEKLINANALLTKKLEEQENILLTQEKTPEEEELYARSFEEEETRRQEILSHPENLLKTAYEEFCIHYGLGDPLDISNFVNAENTNSRELMAQEICESIIERYESLADPNRKQNLKDDVTSIFMYISEVHELLQKAFKNINQKIKEEKEYIQKNAEVLRKIAERPNINTVILEQNNNGMSPNQLDNYDQRKLLTDNG